MTINEALIVRASEREMTISPHGGAKEQLGFDVTTHDITKVSLIFAVFGLGAGIIRPEIEITNRDINSKVDWIVNI